MIEILQNHKRVIFLSVTGLFCLVLIAWNHEPVNQAGNAIYYRDTVPARESRQARERDFDEELKKLEEARLNLEEISTKNWKEISQNIQQELKKINTEELKTQIDLAMKDVDFKKMNEDLKSAIKEINLEDLHVRINESLADIKIDIRMDEVRKALAEARVELNTELEEVKKINKDEIKNAIRNAEEEITKAMSEIKIDNSVINESLEKAKEGIEKARQEVKGYQEMIYSMEEDELISTKEDYNIEYRDGSIYINDLKQSEVVTSKYSKYFSKENVTISKKNGKLTIKKSDDED